MLNQQHPVFVNIVGGDHMAESITGRVFLSSWWIFSLTIMAVYSGNFVALLTVSKEVLDFNGMAELIELDDYKWGFLGGTVYVDIFNVRRSMIVYPFAAKANIPHCMYINIVSFSNTCWLVSVLPFLSNYVYGINFHYHEPVSVLEWARQRALLNVYKVRARE